ncbi:class A beta-lactamase-related serine hydrolase [Mycobacterium camsae]|uniref:class A beta-lactamase-related serine hydrolase n=1 Tax=Mycobacterium gordonae TaxID=1778 RepID=UPI001F11D92B|nr:class A beta-lactamase-related serine hydrolase [Mycobacterium gordonae]
MTSPSSAPAAQHPDLAAEFAQLASRLNARMGLAVTAVGSDEPPAMYGDWQQGPAWSTIKVPLAIAAYRQQHNVTAQLKATITESDNAAAEALWQQLGDPVTAAGKVQDILRETGDPTIVESRKLRPEFTAFGQTIWSLADQVRFIAQAFCDKRYDPIFVLMGQIVPQQSWGMGALPAAQFKGGWGPSPADKYLVRQFGVVNSGRLAVAIAAEPTSGSFDDGTRALDEAATWLRAHLARLPTGGCPGNP